MLILSEANMQSKKTQFGAIKTKQQQILCATNECTKLKQQTNKQANKKQLSTPFHRKMQILWKMRERVKLFAC